MIRPPVILINCGHWWLSRHRRPIYGLGALFEHPYMVCDSLGYNSHWCLSFKVYVGPWTFSALVPICRGRDVAP